MEGGAQMIGSTAQRPVYDLYTRFACIFSVIAYRFRLPIARWTALNLYNLTKI